MSDKYKILAVDDNPDALYALERILKHNGYDVVTAESGEQAYDLAVSEHPSLILLDVVLPAMNGYQLTEKFKSHDELRYTPVLLLSANDALDNVTEGLNRGADDYITKPYQPEELIARLRAALRLRSLYGELKRSKEENLRLRTELKQEYSQEKIIGDSSVMNSLYEMIKKVSAADSAVLVTGPTGSGKELVARAIHFGSSRADKPIIAKNCAALSEHILESELFGHSKGAFTGAIKDRKGVFEIADGGTLFLDEIGEMSGPLQAKLLRVLQEGTFAPVGSNEEKKVDVRVIAATHRDLQKMIDEGDFREDLYYRINVVNLNVPALNKRKEDIPTLVEHFLSARGKSDRKLSSEAMNALCEYSWRGNVRELQNEVERMLIMAGDELQIGLEHLSAHIVDFESSSSAGQSVDPSSLKEAIEEVEKEYIRKEMLKNNGNKSKVATILGISRSSLISKVKQYGIEDE